MGVIAFIGDSDDISTISTNKVIRKIHISDSRRSKRDHLGRMLQICQVHAHGSKHRQSATHAVSK